MLRSCQKVVEWMDGYDRPWGIAGGWAIDLFIGNKTRDHSDIEIAILREDQQRMKNALADWSFQKVVNGELVDWESETLELPIHELHGKHQKSGECLEVLLNEVENDLWIFRRESDNYIPKFYIIFNFQGWHSLLASGNCPSIQSEKCTRERSCRFSSCEGLA